MIINTVDDELYRILQLVNNNVTRIHTVNEMDINQNEYNFIDYALEMVHIIQKNSIFCFRFYTSCDIEINISNVTDTMECSENIAFVFRGTETVRILLQCNNILVHSDSSIEYIESDYDLINYIPKVEDSRFAIYSYEFKDRGDWDYIIPNQLVPNLA